MFENKTESSLFINVWTLTTTEKPYQMCNSLCALLECGRSLVRAQVTQAKDYEVSIWCCSDKHTALRSKSEDGLAQDNVWVDPHVYMWTVVSVS